MSHIDESSLNRIRAKDKKGGMAIVSAARGHMSKKQKAKADTQLGKDIKGKGLPGSTKVKGKYGKEEEPSRVITSGKKGKRKFAKAIKSLGAKHKQDSVLIKKKGSGSAKLHGTTKGAWPGKGKKVTAGKMKPGRTSEHGHTEVKGKKFTYESSTMQRQNGMNMCVSLVWRGRYYTIQFFFPGLKKPTRAEIQDNIQKVYPGAKVNAYYEHPIDRTSPVVRLPESKLRQKDMLSPYEDPDDENTKLDKAKDEKEEKEKKKLEAGEKRINMIKKLVLLKKRQAVNQGAGADVTV